MQSVLVGGRRRRILIAQVLLGTASVLCLGAAPANAQEAGARSEAQVSFNIPPQPLVDALRQFSTQTGIQAVYATSVGSGVTSPGVNGRMSSGEALSRLLAGTGLTFRFTGPQSITLEPAPAADSEAIQLGPVRVEGGAGQGGDIAGGRSPSAAMTEGKQSYTTNAVTIGKTVLNPREIPQTVSVITHQRIEDQNLITIDDALQQTPGITVLSTGERRSTFSARGFGIDTIQVDGLPTSLSGNNVLLSPELALYDRVEVIRGANGLLQGTGDPSASINLVRKRPTSALAASATVSAGSWNNYRAEVDVGGPIDASGRLRARVVGSFQDRDYFYDFAHRRRWIASGIADYRPTDSTTITLGYTYIGNHATPSVTGVPRYSDGGALGLPRSTYLGAAWSRWRTDNQNGFVEIRQEIGDWVGQLLVQRSVASNYTFTTSVTGAVNRATGTGSRLANASLIPDYGDKQTGGDVYFTGPVHLFGREHTLLFGLTARKGLYEFSSAVATPSLASSADVFNFDPTSVPQVSATGIYSYRYHSWTRQLGAYGSARLQITDALTAILGGRISWWDTRSSYSQPALNVFPSTQTSKKGIFTPYVGLVYKLAQSVSLYASYADVFQPQTGLQYPGTVLPPVVGANYEAGIKAGFLDDRLNATLAVFQVEQTNRAVNDPAYPCTASSPVCYMLAAGKARSRGFEAEVNGNVTERWKISAGYTYTDTEYVKDTDASGNPTSNQGQPFNPFTPKHLFKVWTDLELSGRLSGLSIGGGIQAQSKVYVQSGTVRIIQDAYALANARIAYRLNEHFSVSANLNNIFDKTYYSGLGTLSSNNYYGEPRNFVIALRGRY